MAQMGEKLVFLHTWHKKHVAKKTAKRLSFEELAILN
jgi:hypothetical protein